MTYTSVKAWDAKLRILARSRLVPTAVGFVLFSAAVLKALDRQTGNSGFIISGRFLYLLLAFELLFAIWLWSRVWSAASRLIALALFSCFAVYNWSQVAAGTVSCACFGRIGLSPWMAFSLDVVAIVLLVFWQPVSAQLLTRAQLGVGILLFCLAGITAFSGREKKPADGILEVIPRVVDLGMIPQGATGVAEFVVRNPSDQAIPISEIQSSCPCLRVRLPLGPLEPGAEMRCNAVLDMSKEPGFTGNLAIDIKARTRNKEAAFGMVVMADVRNGN